MTPLVLFAKCLVAAETMAVVAGGITWTKWKNTELKWFVFYLMIIVVCEACNRLDILQNNAAVADVFEYVVPFEILFVSWFFYKVAAVKNRKLILTGIAVYIVSLIIENTIFKNEHYYFSSLSYTVGNLFILMYCILFFIELVNSDKILQYRKMAVFWIVLGMLVFYLGTFPFYGLYNELAKNRHLFLPVAWAAMSLNYCMYLLFTIAFIWGQPR